MAFSKATLIQRVRDVLGTTEVVDTLNENLPTAGDTTLTVTDGTKWAEGAVGEFQDDGEKFFVTGVSSNNLTVIRGWGGTTATATHATAAVILRDPVYGYSQIVDSINQTLTTLWPHCWKKIEDTVTPLTTANWYALTATAVDFIQVYQLSTSTPSDARFYGATNTLKPVIGPIFNLPAGLVSTGCGIKFRRGFFNYDNTVYVHSRAKLAATVANSNYSDITDGNQVETVTYGAAARLVYNREVPRVSQDDTSMGDATVTPGNRWSVGKEVYKRFVELRNDWHDELLRTIPPMGQWSH